MQPHGNRMVAPQPERIHPTVATDALTGVTTSANEPPHEQRIQAGENSKKAGKAALRGGIVSNLLHGLAAGLALLVWPASGQTIWDGGGTDNNWNTAANWNNNIAPTNPSGSVLHFAGAIRLTPQVNAAWTVNGLQFDSGASAFTVGDTFITVGTSSGIVNASASLQTITSGIIMGAAQTWSTTSTGNLAVAGSITNGGYTLTTNAATGTTIALSGSIRGTGGITTTTGAGLTTLSGNNTYSGINTVGAGTILRATTYADALGSSSNAGAVTLSGGTLQLANDTGLNYGRNTTVSTTGSTITSDRLTSGAGVTHTLGNLSIGAQTLNVSAGTNVSSGTAGLTFGNTTLSASGAIFNTGASTNLTLGALAGNFNFTKQGTGALTLNSDSTRSSGTSTFTQGTVNLGSTSALGTTGTTISLGGATLDLNANASVNAYNTSLTTSSTIVSDRATSGAGITHTLGTLGIGTQTLSVTAGTNVASGTAGLTFGATTLSATGAVFDTGTGTNLTLGALAGNFNFTKQGAGILTLDTAATRTSTGNTTTLTAGTLKLGNATALGTASSALSLNGGTLRLAPTSDVATTLVGGNNVTVGGTTATISSDRGTAPGIGLTHTLGTLSIGAQTLNITAGSNVTGGTAGVTFGTTTLSATGAVFDTGANTNLTLGALAGNFNFTKQGAGILTLDTAATRTSTGNTTTLTAGTLKLGNASSLGTAASTLNLNGGTLFLDPTNDSATTYNGGKNVVMGGNAAIVSGRGASAGAGLTHTLGTLSIGANTLSVSAGGNVTSGTAGLTFGTTTLSANGAVFDTGTGTNLTLGALAGNFNFTKQGAGILNLDTTATRSGGTTTLTAGTLQLGTASALGTAASTLNLNGGTLRLDPTSNANTTYNGGSNVVVGGNATILSDRNTGPGAGLSHTLGTLSVGANTLTIAPGINVNSGTAAITFAGNTTLAGNAIFNITGVTGGAAASLTLTGVVSDGASSFGITKNGTGALTLNANNTFNGPLTVNAGTVTLAGTNTGIGNLVINGGALSATSTTNNAINAASTLTFGGTGSFNRSLNATTQALGTLTFSAGDGTVTATRLGGAANSITFGTLATRTEGATATFGTSGGTNGSNISINLTGQAAGFMNQGAFYGTTGSTYAWMNAAGTYVRGINYAGTEGGTAATVAGGATLGNSGKFVQTTAAVTAQATDSIKTLEISSGAAANFTLANNAVLTLSEGGLLRTGGSSTTISGTGTAAIQAGTNKELVIRTVAAGDSLTINTPILANGANALTKSGLGTLTLAGTNTYTGNTYLNAGTLNLNNAAALGSGAGTLVINGGTIANTSGGAITLTGNNAQSWAGDFTFTGTNALNLGTGAVTLTGDRSLTINGANALTVGGAIGGTFGLTMAGSGTLVFGGSNSYNGGTTLNGGTLTVNSGASLAGSTGALTVTGGTLNLNNTTQTIGSLNGTGGTINLGTGHTLTVSNSGTDSFAGVLASAGGLTKTGSGTLTLSGTNTYSGNTTVTGGTLIASGSNSLGASTGNVAVTAGSLSLAGGTTITKSGSLSLAGTGTSSTVGALHAGGATGTTSQWNGNISLTANTTITAADNLLILGEGSTFSNTISLGANTLTFHTPNAVAVTPTYLPGSYTLDAANVMVNSAINGTGGVTKTGAGTLMLIPIVAGGSGFTGPLTITGGRVIVDGYEGAGPVYNPGVRSSQITVGNASSPGSPDTVILQMGQLASPPASNNTIGTYNVATNASSSDITIYSDGVFLMNRAANGFVNINLTGGHIDGGTAAASLTVSGGINTYGAANSAVIENGSLLMSANGFTFNIADGSAAADLRVDSTVQSGIGFTGGGSATGLVKTGLGTMVLTGANTYQGTTNISAGILNIRNASALGQYGGSLGDTANGTIVQSGAQLQLEHATGLTVALETLTLKGDGGGTGALRNVSGNNIYNGFIYLGADSRINADAGTTLTIANTSGVNAAIINGDASGRILTFGGAGNTTVNGGISSFISNVVKDGSGTLNLAGNNGYVGTTTVGTGGAIRVTHNNGLSGTGVTVASGGALQFAQTAAAANITVVAVPVGISGTGISNDGAIRNLNGSNSFLGSVTLNNDARINADTGSNFTLSGGVSSNSKSLTVGGAGNTTVSATINLDAMSSGTRGNLTKDGSGTFTFNAAGSLSGSVGKVHIAEGTFAVGGTGSATLNTDELTATSLGTMLIASGGTVNAVFNEGITVFNGNISGSSVGTLALSSSGSTSSGIRFNETINAAGLTLRVGGSSIGGSDETQYFTLQFGGGKDITVGTLRITGDTILDFNNSAGTFLSSATLIIDAGVKILVKNWISVADTLGSSTAWIVSNSSNGIQSPGGNITLGGTDAFGTNPLNQITFSSYTGLTTTWVSGNHSGWFDHEIRPTPEPATYGAIFLSGCLGLLGWRRFSSRQKAATVTKA